MEVAEEEDTPKVEMQARDQASSESETVHELSEGEIDAREQQSKLEAEQAKENALNRKIENLDKQAREMELDEEMSKKLKDCVIKVPDPDPDDQLTKDERKSMRY